MYLMIMQRSTSDAIHRGLPKCHTVESFLGVIRQKFKESDKCQTLTLMNTVIYSEIWWPRKCSQTYLRMIDCTSKLKSFEIDISDHFLIDLALNSLSNQFRQLKITLMSPRKVRINWTDLHLCWLGMKIEMRKGWECTFSASRRGTKK